MYATRHLPGPRGLRCSELSIHAEVIKIRVRCVATSATCPICRWPSRRVHSRYGRTLADLPWHGVPVRIELLARRFFCDIPTCPRRIFAERLSDVAAAYARKTWRFIEAIESIAFTCGGEPGARLATRLGMPVSPDTLLRCIRRAAADPRQAPRVLGVDDWAWRRGQRYGTLLCDLERHHPVDLLPERSAESLSAWLAEHPEIQVISRDRAGCYAHGASAGAPQAIQIADRWHLLRNMRDALERLIDRRHQQVAETAHALAEACQSDAPAFDVAAFEGPGSQRAPPPQTTDHAGNTRRRELYRQVMALHEQDLSQREIGRQVGLHRETVARWIHAGQLPQRARRPYASRTDPFTDYLIQRWQQGCHNAAQLDRELKERGFRGSYCSVQRRVAPWRRFSAQQPWQQGTSVRSLAKRRPSAKRLAWLLPKDSEDMCSDDRAFVEALFERCPELAIAADVGRQFVTMVRQRRADQLDDWLERAGQKDVPRQLRGLATSLKSDYQAVHQALTQTWSNGQVEGQINRLKLIKRQMYGRANHDLLRQRVLRSV
jgi:transposase